VTVAREVAGPGGRAPAGPGVKRGREEGRCDDGGLSGAATGRVPTCQNETIARLSTRITRLPVTHKNGPGAYQSGSALRGWRDRR